ncbi:hypothetical protein THRCLA_10039 [Thraustotheca clavata]|uniref:WD repeat-containing protein 65 n=1 Tax=Thraustotheca clavata TaxID=74557 RepID=A0A1V9YT01_9STRA|nr:hypothetical protein THRCLA_10039 [Thraustotheca clavata]
MVTSSRKHMFALLGTTYGGRTAMAIYGQEDTSGSLHYHFGHAVPICIDYHPSGYEAIVCYSVQLQIYHVLFDTMKLAFEVELRHATNVAYNRGGNYFLALVEERFVYVYRNYDGIEPSLISVCKGHINAISAIRWGFHDSSFYTGDERGDLRFWTLIDDEGFISTQAHFDEKERHRSYEAIATAHDTMSGQHLVAAAFTTDTGMSGLHTWSDGNFSVAPLKLEDFDSKIACLEFSASAVLCVGLESGSLLIYWWEIVNECSLKLCTKPLIYDLTVSPIVSLRSCLNERVLVTTSSDGVIFSLQIAVNAPMPILLCSILPTTHTIESVFTSMCPADELCLVERASVTEKILHIADLETEKEQLKIEKEIMSKLNAEQRTLLDRERHAEVRAVKTALESKIHSTEDQMQLKIDQTNADAATVKAGYEKDLNTMQTALTLKIETLNDICVKLEMDLIKAKQHADDTLFAGEERCMLLRKELDREHKAELKKQRDEIERLTKALNLKTREFNEVLSQQDEDQLTHLASMQAAIEQEKGINIDITMNEVNLVHGKKSSESAKNAISNLQQQLRMMLNALDIKSAEIDSLTTEKSQLNTLVHSLQSELAAERKKATKSIAECASLEAQVADLSRSLDGLERLNNIRLCKLKTIKDEMAQKEVEYDEMQAFAEELHNENSHVITDANAMDELTRQMQRELEFYERTVETQKKSLAEVSAILTAFRRDLGILIENEQNGCRLKIEAIVKLYHKYEPNSLKARNVQREMGTDEAIIQELTRQNKCVEDHRRKLRLRMDSAAMEKSKMAALISREHQKLLDEVNRLTRENHELKRKAVCAPIKQVDAVDPGNNNSTHEIKQILTPFAKREQAFVTKAEETCRVYIPCGINVLNPPQAENVLKTTTQPLIRPKTSKPKLVIKTTPTTITRKAITRPKSALPKSTTIRLSALS